VWILLNPGIYLFCYHFEQLLIFNERLEDIETAIDFIRNTVTNGGHVYIHCKAGKGRSATYAMCYLMLEKKKTPMEAQLHLLSHRPQVSKKLMAEKSCPSLSAEA